MSRRALDEIRRELTAEGGLLAGAVREGEPVAVSPWPQLAAGGPRVQGRSMDIEFAVAAVHEGHQLHYGSPAIVDIDGDPDLALLAGDRLYAMGLDRLAVLGDLVAVAELADVIALCAQAHASGDEELADAVWHAGAVAVGWGPTPDLAQAKSVARGGRAGAAVTLREAALRASTSDRPRDRV